MMSESQLDSLLRDVVACVAQMPERGEARAQLEAASATRSGRLRWVREHWLPWLPDALRARVLLALDQLAEWESSRGGAAGPAEVPTLHGSSEAHFSDDEDWMRDAVLMAKVAYVWLHQLGVAKLDEIPDTALDQLQARGITALWLIGVWERSPASRDIKRRQGNSEAEASAYALRDYCIASRLGGEEALALLTERARTRGIRLAADMVPNHMGMDSRWMVEHPSWFLQLSAPPFPGYSFDGPDVSGDPAIGVFLEDGYWTQTDAAVVFKCVDRSTGTERFVYHGNDGTQMPWNDTAQLDFLQPEVREAVIGVIVEVARLFPVLRFDAAMTLARQHVQRLWYPSPGSGGAIPSRAVNSVPSAVFERGMPEEFWREVVARVREEVPDTLLVAEAFWMMEGYFVRDLGMHRVYNSAFMHMLRDEDNVRFRASIKEILAQSPAVLERFVNFMNNPDEDTAIAQFGSGDKYFGVATLLATLPGLPMWGHGQFEGFSEKYGMEFGRSYVDEAPNAALVARHEAEIVPLLKARHVFGGVDDFAFFDLRSGGTVDENVYAFSNGDAWVLFNNANRETRGEIYESSPVNTGTLEAPVLVCRRLAEPLSVTLGPYECRVRLS